MKQYNLHTLPHLPQLNLTLVSLLHGNQTTRQQKCIQFNKHYTFYPSALYVCMSVLDQEHFEYNSPKHKNKIETRILLQNIKELLTHF